MPSGLVGSVGADGERASRRPTLVSAVVRVDWAFQGQGLGTQLVRYCLEIVDESGFQAYLETPNPRTVPFYERAGFSITGLPRLDIARQLR